MRILFLSQEYPPETGWGGIGSFVKIAGAALAQRGHEVHVLSCAEGLDASDDRDGDVVIHRRPIERVGLPGRKRRLSSTAKRLDVARSCRKALRALGRFDVIETPDWMAEGLFVPPSSGRLVAHLHSPAPVIAEFEPGGRDLALASALERRTVNRASLVTAPSAAVLERLRTSGWLRNDIPAEVIFQPLDLELWSGLPPVAETDPVVLCVGRLERRKAPEVLVRAMARVPEGATCIFAGKSSGTQDNRSYGRFLELLAAEVGAPCEFLGAVQRHELPALMARARVVALPSRFESFGISGAEGLAAQRPLVATTACGLVEAIEGTGGVFVPPDDVPALAEALGRYLSSPAEAERDGRAGRARIAESCAPDLIAQQREAAYGKALSV